MQTGPPPTQPRSTARIRAVGSCRRPAAPGLLVLVAVLAYLPGPAAWFVPPGDPRWAAVHWRWLALPAGVGLALLWSTAERHRGAGGSRSR